MSHAEPIRVATFNASLSRKGPGLLLRDIQVGKNKQLRNVIAIIQTVRPDILLLNEFDLIIRGMTEFGLQAKREDFAFRIDNQVSYLEAIKAGVGIGASQRRQAERYDLVEVLPQLKLPPIPVWFATHTELRTSARVRRAFDFLAEYLPARLWF